MKWVSDTTGRFEWRPYYDQIELDNACEQIVADFFRTKNSTSQFPISTDDLSVMIEQNTSDLDLYADLSGQGEDVEGLTDFFPNRKPAVKIARELSLESSRRHRLRTTLSHEFGHVKFHSFLWDYNHARQPVSDLQKKIALRQHRYAKLRQTFSHPSGSPAIPNTTGAELLSGSKSGSCFRCRRAYMFDAPLSDWMEWQAGYVGGAVLMPRTLLGDLFRNSLPAKDNRQWLPNDSEIARELILRTAEEFDVSTDAARVRLLKLGYIQYSTRGNIAVV
jgi:hypothetical protein